MFMPSSKVNLFQSQKIGALLKNLQFLINNLIDILNHEMTVASLIIQCTINGIFFYIKRFGLFLISSVLMDKKGHPLIIGLVWLSNLTCILYLF